MLGVYLLQQVYPYDILIFHRLYLLAMVGDGIKPKKFFHLILFCLCATENTIFRCTPSVNIWVIFIYYSVLFVKYAFEIGPRWEHGCKAKSESEVYILLAWFSFVCFVWYICFHLYCHVLLWRQWPYLVSSHLDCYNQGSVDLINITWGLFLWFMSLYHHYRKDSSEDGCILKRRWEIWISELPYVKEERFYI